MSGIQYPETGKENIDFSATDNCGLKTRGTRMVNIIQKLLEGNYVEITESGDTATISVDPSADYYNKYQINELLGDIDTVKFKIVNTLPVAGAENVIYLVPKASPDTGYDQYIWNSDDAQFHAIGDTDIDLSDYYTKVQIEENYYNKVQTEARYQKKLTNDGGIPAMSDTMALSRVDPQESSIRYATGLTIWNYIKSKITGSISNIVTDNLERSRAVVTDAFGKLNISGVYSAELEQLSGIDTTKTVQTQLNEKQDELTASDEISEVQDNTPISSVNLTTKKIAPILASTVWEYIESKITGAVSNILTTNLTASRVLVSYSSGKIGVANTTQSEIEYLNGVTHKLSIKESSGTGAFGYNSSASAGLTITGDYDTNQPRRAWSMGGLAGISFHCKGTATAASANWTTIGTVTSAYRPKYVTPISAMIYDGNNGNQAAGGYVHTDGRIVLWTNAKSATNNYQVRVNVTYLVTG